MVKIALIPQEAFQRVREANLRQPESLALIADMCRANTLAMIKRAGSGHIGSSFSSLDLVTFLYYAQMNTATMGAGHPDRDIFFSSKGHDCPGLYAVLFSLGLLPKEQFVNLRRLDGTCGHPDVSLPGMEANTGSLGMGISKAKGMAYARRLRGAQGRIFVMIGDGELQEGQIYEALQTAVHQRLTNLTVIIDHNKVQTDKLVSEITDLGDLAAKFRAFGWHVARCDGHDFRQLQQVFTALDQISDQPKILIADTIKGRGVSFMEHPAALAADGGLYRWHAGAPDDEAFTRGYHELITRIQDRLKAAGLPPLTLEELPLEPSVAKPGTAQESVGDAFGHALIELAARRTDLVVLDADLSADCHLRAFEARYPDRFIEDGIAEQDMVSMAGGLALRGLLPVVNTFAAFLTAKANEQIYNNASERTKIIYACHYAGLLPAGPGLSHQSIRDISLLGALPNMVIIQPCNAAEAKMAVRYAVEEAKESCALRLTIGPPPSVITLPAGYQFRKGQGIALTEGEEAILFAYGPVMLHQALIAAHRLREQARSLQVVNMPWLNRMDPQWLHETIRDCQRLYVLEDHSTVGGLGARLLQSLAEGGELEGRRVRIFGVEGYPAWGTASEVLRYHGLDGAALAEAIMQDRQSEVVR